MLGQIIFLVILIFVNAYFAASELAFISLNDAKVEKDAKKGNKKAKQIQKMLKEPSKFLATIQIGITLAGFLSSAFASETFAERLAPIFNNWMPFLSIGTWEAISIVVITIILSFFTLVFGELVPKRLAMKYYEKIAYATIGVIYVISKVTAPFVKVLTASTNFVSKLFGVGKQEEETVSEEEIRMMIEQGQEKGVIQKDEKELLNNVFEFNDTTASEIMKPRTQVTAIDLEDDKKEMINTIKNCKYSRIPIYRESIDKVQGILYIKDVLKSNEDLSSIDIEKIMRTPYFVSETTPINKLFKSLQKNKKQIAIVVDEYGGTSGIVTMEDILEELVGNIFDEYDEIEKDYEKLDNQTYLMDGDISIVQARKVLKIDIPDGDYDTLSGYILEKLERLPKEGEILETDKATYKIEEYEDRTIKKVKIAKNLPLEEK